MATTIDLELETEFIPLAALLKLAGVADSGGRAKQMVQDGLVAVNGAQELRRGAKIRPGDVVELDADPAVRIAVR